MQLEVYIVIKCEDKKVLGFVERYLSLKKKKVS